MTGASWSCARARQARSSRPRLSGPNPLSPGEGGMAILLISREPAAPDPGIGVTHPAPSTSVVPAPAPLTEVPQSNCAGRPVGPAAVRRLRIPGAALVAAHRPSGRAVLPAAFEPAVLAFPPRCIECRTVARGDALAVAFAPGIAKGRKGWRRRRGLGRAAGKEEQERNGAEAAAPAHLTGRGTTAFSGSGSDASASAAPSPRSA